MELTNIEITEKISKYNRWMVDWNSLVKEFKFTNFVEAMDFVYKLASVFEELQHHWKLIIDYSTVKIKTTSHDCGNVITAKDINLVEKIENL